jgi:hypothetical protein
LERIIQAILGAAPACITTLTIVNMPVYNNLVCLVGANSRTSTAHGTQVRPKTDLRLARLRLRVVAPLAAQGATFKEDNRADARAIMKPEALDVKNYSSHLRC